MPSVLATVLALSGLPITAAPPPDGPAPRPDETAPGPDDTAWSPPADAPVALGYRRGSGRWDVGGHAGLDYAVPPGSPVRAAGRGVVTFAGPVAGSTFVVVSHGGELRTTYAPFDAVRVRRGDVVERGDVLGTTSAAPLRKHAAGLVHFGLRRGDDPLDPGLLFTPPAGVPRVRLVPADDPRADVVPAEASERRSLLRWFGAGVGAAGRLVGRVARSGSAPGVTAPWLAVEAVAGARDWSRRRGRCTPAGTPPPDPGPDRHLVVVGGLNAVAPGRVRRAHELGRRLGYPPDRVHSVSPAREAAPEVRSDTHRGPAAVAGALAGELRRLARDAPGASVDLVGHSQGGVAVEAFLKRDFGRGTAQRAYPAVRGAVTLAAPHRGVPLAGAAAALTGGSLGPLAARGLTSVFGGLPGPRSGAFRDLVPGSDFLEDLDDRELPPGVRLTTIGAADDVVVPAPRTRVGGADHVVVDPPGVSDHSAILEDAQSAAAVGHALAGSPPPCTSLIQSVRFRVEPRLFDVVPEAIATLLVDPSAP